jgi:hypothetical protein
MRLDDAAFAAKLSLLKEKVSHHAHAEEEGELFPMLRDVMTDDELATIGNEYLVQFEALMQFHPSKNVPAETDKATALPSRSYPRNRSEPNLSWRPTWGPCVYAGPDLSPNP